MPESVRRSRFLTTLLVAALASPAFGQAPAGGQTRPGPLVSPPGDVVLIEGGLLYGQVRGVNAQPTAGAAVRLYTAAGKAVDGRANNRGEFAFRRVGPGVYYLQSGQAVELVRVWPADAAPPAAKAGVLLIGETSTVRAQYAPPSKLNMLVQRTKRVMSNPVAVAGVVAAAVAIPVAVHNADDGS
ncbi:MAG: hypothetical protein AAF790_01605 [Planctomycetota bacterium]